jgi:hypothetical protein
VNNSRLLVQVAKDGTGVRWSASDRRQLQHWAGKWLVVRPVQRKRSLEQNAYWHACVFPPIAEWSGDDIEGTKLSLMGACWGWKVDKLTGHEVPVKPHTSSMTVEEGVYFTDWVIPWAALNCNGLQIMLPGEWQAGQ